jgi:CheY-like chemotaxis protein
MITELHHGTISARSDGPGTGATFVVELPLARIEDGVEHLGGGTPAGSQERTAEETPKQKVLLIEDHEPSRVTLSRLLARRGFEVVPAASISEAREVAAKHVFAFSISDIGLPDGDGVELIRELNTRYKLQTIALTGYGTTDDIRRCVEAGALAHMTKPISIAALESVLSANHLRPSDREKPRGQNIGSPSTGPR